MQKEILKGLLAVKVPKMAFDISMPESTILRYREWVDYPHTSSTYNFKNPPGSWQLLGRVSEISEEVAATLVERWDSGRWNDYSRHLARVNTATESLASLLRSHGFEPEETVLLKADVNNS